MTNENLEPVSAAQVRWSCDPLRFTFEDTSQVTPIDGVIGQRRALDALKLGLELDAPGYNLFVCGLTGTGRMSSLQSHLEKVQPYCRLVFDRAYVMNFREPFRPSLLVLPRGQGVPLAKAMDELLLELLLELPDLLNSDQARACHDAARKKVDELRQEERSRFEERLAREGFSLVEVATEDRVQGVLRVKVAELPEPMPLPALEQVAAQGLLDAEHLERLRGRFEAFEKELGELARGWHSLELEFLREMGKLRHELCQPWIHTVVSDLGERFQGEGVPEYLAALEENLIENAVALVQLAGTQDQPPESLTPDLALALYRFRVNVVHDSSRREDAPVVVETQPTFTNLFGGVDRTPGREELLDDFHALRAGSLLEADGGYLIMNAQDVLRQPGVWGRLKAGLRDGVVEIPETDPENRRTTIMKPQPIPLRVKVVLMGSYDTYLQCLYADTDFQQVFKVRVDFDRDHPISDGFLNEQVPAIIAKVCRDESLSPLDRGAVALAIERAVRWAGRRGRLSTRFTQLADLVREASYWAGARGSQLVEKEDVRQAIRARDDRISLREETLRRRIVEGTVLIQLQGEAVGQLNALVVQTVGVESFGQPVRLSARIGMGSEGVVNIEREVGLSGPTHDKGMQILTGYLHGHYADRHPISLTASVCFEQSYGGVDGDSASSTEVYALLSAISGIPLRQDIAVSGSVNQRGQIQAVGGLNEKIEGYYRVVKDLGFPGEPGVMIPRCCLPELMLASDVVEAIETSKFRVYGIESIDEGLELLMGIPAGERGEDGAFPVASVHGRVKARLEELATGLARFQSRFEG